MKDIYVPEIPSDIRENPIRRLDDWNVMRATCEKDPGAFHADIAATEIHWFDPDSDSWMSRQANGSWRGCNASSGDPAHALSWQPWRQALDETAS